MLHRFLAIAVALPLVTAVPAIAQEHTFASAANGLCRAAIDARDHQAFTLADDLTVEVLATHIRGRQPPDTATAQRLIVVLEAVNADLSAAIDSLIDLGEADPALSIVLSQGRAQIAVNSLRIGFLQNLDDWQWPMIDGLDVAFPDHGAYLAALAELGLANRDCQHVFASRGAPESHAGFIAAVAPVCAMVVDRRLATDFGQWRETGLQAFIASVEGTAQSSDAIPALREMSAEWYEAVDDFATIDPMLAPNAGLWQQALTAMSARAESLAQRADAIESGDETLMTRAFANRPAPPDFKMLGLGETSCMALSEHF